MLAGSMITIASLRDLDFATAATAALLAVVLLAYPAVPLLAAIAQLISPQALFAIASGAAVRWALKLPATGSTPAGPTAVLGIGATLEPRAGA